MSAPALLSLSMNMHADPRVPVSLFFPGPDRRRRGSVQSGGIRHAPRRKTHEFHSLTDAALKGTTGYSARVVRVGRASMR